MPEKNKFKLKLLVRQNFKKKKEETLEIFKKSKLPLMTFVRKFRDIRWRTGIFYY